MYGTQENSPKRAIQSNTGQPYEARKISSKQSNFILKGTRRTTGNKKQSEQKEENKDQSGNDIETKNTKDK